MGEHAPLEAIPVTVTSSFTAVPGTALAAALRDSAEHSLWQQAGAAGCGLVPGSLQARVEPWPVEGPGCQRTTLTASLTPTREVLARLARLEEENRELREKGAVQVLRMWRDSAAERLADEVAVLTKRGVLDQRSPAADALLDFREPPMSPRADRLAELEREVGGLKAQLGATTQATTCAQCGVFKHTPWCAPSGYICAGCLGKQVESLTSDKQRLEAEVAQLTREREGEIDARVQASALTRQQEARAEASEAEVRTLTRQVQALQVQVGELRGEEDPKDKRHLKRGGCPTKFYSRCVRGAGHHDECAPELSPPTAAQLAPEGGNAS